MKHVVITDFLTEDQINQCVEIYDRNPLPAKEIAEKVIEPNMAEINKKLGQENDAHYLAYMVEYVLGVAKTPRNLP